MYDAKTANLYHVLFNTLRKGEKEIGCLHVCFLSFSFLLIASGTQFRESAIHALYVYDIAMIRLIPTDGVGQTNAAIHINGILWHYVRREAV